MEKIAGLSNRVLEIDLSSNSYTVYNVPEELTRLYLKGKRTGPENIRLGWAYSNGSGR